MLSSVLNSGENTYYMSYASDLHVILSNFLVNTRYIAGVGWVEIIYQTTFTWTLKAQHKRIHGYWRKKKNNCSHYAPFRPLMTCNWVRMLLFSFFLFKVLPQFSVVYSKAVSRFTAFFSSSERKRIRISEPVKLTTDCVRHLLNKFLHVEADFRLGLVRWKIIYSKRDLL